MGNITLLELHVPDGDIQIGPKSLRGSTASTETEAEQATSVEPADEGGRSLGSLLVAVGVVAVLVVIATKLLGEDADEELAGFDESA